MYKTLLSAILLISISGVAQIKELNAIRINAPIKIDGILQEKEWALAPEATQFVVNSPNFGATPKNKTSVKILYDDDAMYVAAYIYDDPKLVRKQLTSRDGESRQDIDYFSVFFDTYNDDQNGFQFTVTSRNVQSDGRVSASLQSRFGPPSDYSWDAVWESNVTFVQDGWIAEMKIPYISLRFSKEKKQKWGVNFYRYDRRNNEASYWNAINPNIAGFVNQFGDLTGLENITPALRLSFLPYITSGYRSTPTKKGTVNEFLRNGGADIKYGLNESFTLDATLIPDFGQVISDNVVLNLSAFEVRFNENRPFFTEGTELFNKAGLFYSRRIGATPMGYYSVRNKVLANTNLRMIKNPGVTQLLNASKFSGRNKKNLGIGVFNAISSPMYAEFEDASTGQSFKEETQPLTNFNIVVVDQILKNRSSIAFTNANTIRNGSSRDANVSALDVSLFDKRNRYNLNFRGRYSQIFGAKNYSGYATYTSIGKVSGKIQYQLQNNIESDEYDINDLGFLMAPNEVKTSFNISYNQFTPTKKFNSFTYSLNLEQIYLFKPYKWQEYSYTVRGFWFFKNFWDAQLQISGKPKWYNDFFDLRTPGSVIQKVPYYLISTRGSSDSRKKLYGRWQYEFAKTPIKEISYVEYDLGLRYRFSDKFTLDYSANRVDFKGDVGYAFKRESNGEPIAGRRDKIEFTSLLQGTFNFTSRMNITMRARHYWSNVHYKKFYNVDKDGNWIDRAFINNLDQNYNAFNVDMFYTWDFKYGSRLIVSWKNWLATDYSVDGNLYKNYTRNLGQVFNMPQGKEISVRLVYFLDYNKLKRKS